MPKILITGSNSFIGNKFKKHSICNDIEEVSLIQALPEEVNFEKYDVVLHLAAIVHQSKTIPDNEYFKINRDLALQVAKNAKRAGVKQFVFMSTLKVYGNIKSHNELRNEDSLCCPDDAYGRSKYEAETGLKKLEDEDFTVSIIRTPLVYGDGVKANMLNLVKLVDRIPFLPFAKTQNRRNFTYIENLVSYIDRIIEYNKSGVFIAMDDNAVSTTELVTFISKYLNKQVHLFHLPRSIVRFSSVIVPSVFDRLFNSLEVDNTQTKRDLNFAAPFSTEEGIMRMVLAYKKQKGLN